MLGHSNVDIDTATGGFGDLLELLSYADGEYLSINHQPRGGNFTSRVAPYAAGLAANVLAAAEGVAADVWVGVNPTTERVGGGRGGASDVTRLAAIWCDLDVKPDACRDLAHAHQIIDELSALLGVRPSAVVSSGGGLQPYWPIDSDPFADDGERQDAAALLKRWGRLACMVADGLGAKIDRGVYDLPRVLRIPGTSNHKYEPPRPVAIEFDTGAPLGIGELRERLDEAGVVALDADDRGASELSPVEGWGYSDTACGYAVTMIRKGWPADSPTARHPHLLGQATRLAVAHRVGCLTEDLHREGRATLERVFAQWCARDGDTRTPGRFEVADAISFGERRASAMSDAQARSELGGHLHDDDLAGRPVRPVPGVAGDDSSNAARGAVSCADAEVSTGSTGLTGSTGSKVIPPGNVLLDDVADWFGRHIAASNDADLLLLTLWAAHTHLVEQLRTTPRLMVDSIAPGSGKTTVLDHLSRLCVNPVQAAMMSSPALLPRMLEQSMCTFLLDEVDRSLRPDKDGVQDLLATLNSGYRFGATRPVLVRQGDDWVAKNMPTFCPVAMAGNAPNLPPDTVSRSIRILLMPDLDGTVEDSDWETIEPAAKELQRRLAEWADAVREPIAGLPVELPADCRGRSKERWRPLKRVAVQAGGRWPGVVDELIDNDLRMAEQERDAGLQAKPPGVVLLENLHEVWRADESFLPSITIVGRLVEQHPDYWGPFSAYGKVLTVQRLGRLLNQSTKAVSQRPGGGGHERGYARSQLATAWRRLGLDRLET